MDLNLKATTIQASLLRRIIEGDPDIINTTVGELMLSEETKGVRTSIVSAMIGFYDETQTQTDGATTPRHSLVWQINPVFDDGRDDNEDDVLASGGNEEDASPTDSGENEHDVLASGGSDEDASPTDSGENEKYLDYSDDDASLTDPDEVGHHLLELCDQMATAYYAEATDEEAGSVEADEGAASDPDSKEKHGTVNGPGDGGDGSDTDANKAVGGGTSDSNAQDQHCTVNEHGDERAVETSEEAGGGTSEIEDHQRHGVPTSEGGKSKAETETASHPDKSQRIGEAHLKAGDYVAHFGVSVADYRNAVIHQVQSVNTQTPDIPVYFTSPGVSLEWGDRVFNFGNKYPGELSLADFKSLKYTHLPGYGENGTGNGNIVLFDGEMDRKELDRQRKRRSEFVRQKISELRQSAQNLPDSSDESDTETSHKVDLDDSASITDYTDSLQAASSSETFTSEDTGELKAAPSTETFTSEVPYETTSNITDYTESLQAAPSSETFTSEDTGELKAAPSSDTFTSEVPDETTSNKRNTDARPDKQKRKRSRKTYDPELVQRKIDRVDRERTLQQEQHVTQPVKETHASLQIDRFRPLASSCTIDVQNDGRGRPVCRYCAIPFPFQNFKRFASNWVHAQNLDSNDKRAFQKIADSHGHPNLYNAVPRIKIVNYRAQFLPKHTAHVLVDVVFLETLVYLGKESKFTKTVHRWTKEDKVLKKTGRKLVLDKVSPILEHIAVWIQAARQLLEKMPQTLRDSLRQFDPNYNDYKDMAHHIIDEHHENFRRGVNASRSGLPPTTEPRDIWIGIADVFANMYLPSIVYDPLYDPSQLDLAEECLVGDEIQQDPERRNVWREGPKGKKRFCHILDAVVPGTVAKDATARALVAM